MTIEGVGKEIDPTLDVFEEARPYFFDLLRQRYAPERIASDVWRGLERLSTTAYDMPYQLREVMDDLRLGRLTLRTEDRAATQGVDQLGRRVFAGLVVAAFVPTGAWLVSREVEWQKWLGGFIMAFGLFWMFWHVVLDLRRRG